MVGSELVSTGGADLDNGTGLQALDGSLSFPRVIEEVPH